MSTLQQDINRFNRKYIDSKERYKAVKWTKETVINPHCKVIIKEDEDEKGINR